jgi:hypothetical protein
MHRLAALGIIAAALLAGCGGSGEHAAPPLASPTTTVEKCKGSKSAAVRALKARRVERDIARLRVLAKPIRTKTLDGTPALSRALDRFLLDVVTRDLPVHQRSRYIDRAAAIVSPVCEQCFQALEASRPTGGGANLGCG